jgi:hypothetical protein
MNVTNTASGASSLLMDLQVGGSSKFNVDKVGTLTLTAGISATNTAVNSQINNMFLTALGTAIGIGTSNQARLAIYSGFISMISGSVFGWSSSATDPSSTADLILGRNAAASLRLGAADAASPVAQTLGVQSVVAGTSNTAGAAFTIAGSKGTGTGVGGSINFQAAIAGSTGSTQNALVTYWRLDGTSGSLVPVGTLTTGMTAGFINIPGAAGAASGTPLSTTGFPMYYDSTNNKIYIYNGSWRSTAALT